MELNKSDIDKVYAGFEKYLNFTEDDIRSVKWHCSIEHMVSKWNLHRHQPCTFLNSLDCINRDILARYLRMNISDFNLGSGFFRGIFCFFSAGSAQEIWNERSDEYWNIFDQANRDGLGFYSKLDKADRERLIEWYKVEEARYGAI